MQGTISPPQPDYYLDWVIQLTLKGYHVYPRTDTVGTIGVVLPSRTAAFDYIDEHTELED